MPIQSDVDGTQHHPERTVPLSANITGGNWAQGANTVLSPSASDKALRISQIAIKAVAANTVQVQHGSVPMWDAVPYALGEGVILDLADDPTWDFAPGEALVLSLGSAANLRGWIRYYEV